MTPLTSVPVHFDRSRSPRLVGDIARELESSGVVDFFQTYDQLTNLLPNALWTPEVTPLSELSADNDSFADGLFLAKRPGACAKIALLSFGNQLCNFFLVWLILRNLGADVSAIGVMIVAPVVFLLIVLPVSIAGWGVREGLFVVCFGLLDVPKDVALAASIVFGLINLLAGLIGGLFWFVEPARSRRPMTEPYPSGETLPQPPAENA